MEKILKIEDTDYGNGYDSMSGLVITTTKQLIKIGISNYQSCCESWGTFSTNDDVQDFVGAEIEGLRLTDVNRSTLELPNVPEYINPEDVMFVDIKTNRGNLQYAVYNAHNGYYAHAVEIISEQLKVNTSL